MTKLFISYAHLDSGIVLNISRQLQEDGYQVWIDKFGIQGGELWASEIVKGIRGCDIFLLFISSNSILSEYVRRELDIAFGEKRKIVHVMIEPAEIPDSWVYQLAGLQYLDYQSSDWKSQLLEALGGSKPTPPQQPPSGTGKLKNPYSSLPVIELVERSLIFSNREKELEEGIEQLKKHRLLLVTGMPGIGKSTFARALLDSRPADSPEPFWYNFERHRSSGNTLGILLERISGHIEICLGIEVQREVMAFRDSPGGKASVNDVDVLIDFFNQEKPIWLVFDNLETVLSPETKGFLDEGLELLFDSLKNSAQNAKIIITNPFVPVLKKGEPFLEAGTQALTLNGLDDASSIAFLHAYGVRDISKNELAPIIQESNGHPFVLDHIARYIQKLGGAAAFENIQGGLEEVNEWFRESLKQRLLLQEFTALQSLTILNREISLMGLCQIAQIRPGVVMRLREMGLLQTNDSGKFWLHNIVRNSIRPTESDALRIAHLHAMDFYRDQTQPAFHKEIDDFASVLEWHFHAVEAGEVQNSFEALYSTGLEEHLMKWSEYELVAGLCERIIAANNLKQIPLSNLELVKVNRTLGAVYFYLGDFLKSITCLKMAVDYSQSAIDDNLNINLLIELAESFNGNQEFVTAMDLCQKALTLLSKGEEDIKLRVRALHLRGIIYRGQGNLDEAIDDLESALKLYKGINDQLHGGNLFVDLGFVYYQKNQFSKAIEFHRNALDSYELQKDMRGAMVAHFNIGDIYLQEEEYGLALIEFQIALEIARKKKIRWMEAYAGLYLAESHIALMNLNVAEHELRILESIITKQSSNCLSGHELALIAMLNWKQKQFEKANHYFKRAFDLFEGANCQEQKARAYLAYAFFLKEQGNLIQANDALDKSKVIFNDLNNLLGLNSIEKAVSELRNN